MNELFLLALLVKHAVADLALQNQLKGINKLAYFGNGHKHYAQHGITAFLTCVLFVNPLVALGLALIDYVAHWHIDYAKHHVCRILKIERNSMKWWWLTSLDQILHYSTYFLIVFIADKYI